MSIAADEASDLRPSEPLAETILEDETLRISGLRGGRKRLFVAFTGIGHRLGALQREEFVRVAQAGGENSVLFVQDKTRSWYNEGDFAARIQPVVLDWARDCGGTITVGNSMGGFGAIVFADLLEAEAAIAFSPQLSVASDVVPQETRWQEFTSRIAAFRYRSAADHMTERPRYYLFQGDGGKDWYQIGGFPMRPNVFQFVVPGGPHNLASTLKARGDLSPIVDACAANDLEALTAILGACGAVRRTPENDAYCGPLRTRVDAVALTAMPPSGAGTPEDEERAERIRRQQARRDRKRTERLARKAEAAPAPSPRGPRGAGLVQRAWRALADRLRRLATPSSETHHA